MSELSRVFGELLRLQDSVACLNDRVWEDVFDSRYAGESAVDRANRFADAWEELDLPALVDRIADGRRAIDDIAEATPR